MQNYVFAKRQRDLAKKKKQEEKRQRKLDAQQPLSSPTVEPPADIASVNLSSALPPVSNQPAVQGGLPPELPPLLPLEN